MAYRLQHILTIVSSLTFHLSIFKWLAAPVMKKISPTFKKLSPKEQVVITNSLTFHLSIFKWLAAPVMKKISPTFKKLSPKEQVVITNSVMSLVHSVVVGGTSAYVFMYPGEVLPTVFWYDSSIARHGACIFLGYTVADLLIMATHPAQYDLMMLVHHLMGVFGAVAGSVDPVLPYFSNLVLLQELSSPFVNMRIILYALGQKTSRLYKLNGVLLLLVFFTCRLATIPLWFRLSPHMATGQLYTVNTPLLMTVFGCMPVVSVFNLYWFTKMCKGAYRILSRG